MMNDLKKRIEKARRDSVSTTTEHSVREAAFSNLRGLEAVLADEERRAPVMNRTRAKCLASSAL